MAKMSHTIIASPVPQPTSTSKAAPPEQVPEPTTQLGPTQQFSAAHSFPLCVYLMLRLGCVGHLPLSRVRKGKYPMHFRKHNGNGEGNTRRQRSWSPCSQPASSSTEPETSILSKIIPTTVSAGHQQRPQVLHSYHHPYCQATA